MSRVSDEWLDCEIRERSEETRPSLYSKRLLSALRELLALRREREGEVVVEGWMYREKDGAHTFTTVDMGPANGWEHVSIAIRRKP